MKRFITILTVSLWAAWLSPAQDTPGSTPTNLPPGTIVRIVAKRPVINLGRAEVLQYSASHITVRQCNGSKSAGTFLVTTANILELDVLESPKAADTGEARDPSAPAGASSKRLAADASSTESTNQPSAKNKLWERIKGFWK